jgi:hydroxymethylglutaryl-CoA synthase
MRKLKKLGRVGIVGYGGYVPRFRIRLDEIARVWGKEDGEVSRSLGIIEKSVPDFDEDAVTMAVEAGKIALIRAGIEPEKIGAVFIGSESHPYAVKPSATIVAEALGIGPDYLTADLEFACKAGSVGIQIVAALLEAGQIEYGLAIGTDVAQGKKGDELEYIAGAGAGAFILGKKPGEFLAQIDFFSSFSSNTPDFWRRDGIDFPSHAGRFTGEMAYFRHLEEGINRFLESSSQEISDFDEIIFHMPNLKFPLKLAQRLGVKEKQFEKGLIVKQIGNPYSASSLLGLCQVLDKIGKNKKILLAAYGSGAGADIFSMKSQTLLLTKRKKGVKLSRFLEQKEELDYSQYLRKVGFL